MQLYIRRNSRPLNQHPLPCMKRGEWGTQGEGEEILAFQSFHWVMILHHCGNQCYICNLLWMHKIKQKAIKLIIRETKAINCRHILQKYLQYCHCHVCIRSLTRDTTLLLITPPNNVLTRFFSSGVISSSFDTKSIKNSAISFCSPVFSGWWSIVYTLQKLLGLYAFLSLS